MAWWRSQGIVRSGNIRKAPKDGGFGIRRAASSKRWVWLPISLHKKLNTSLGNFELFPTQPNKRKAALICFVVPLMSLVLKGVS